LCGAAIQPAIDSLGRRRLIGGGVRRALVGLDDPGAASLNI